MNQLHHLPEKPCELCAQPTTFARYCHQCWEMQRTAHRWFPMETARKNGGRVLMKEFVRTLAAEGTRVHITAWNGRAWAIDCSDWDEMAEPTGWRPLPEG